MGNKKLTITPLGGLGEIGLNCQLWETEKGVVMVDCGLMFPSNEHLGVDVLIPHFGAVSAVSKRLLGIVLTHGHEDHIGALPWIVPQLRGTTLYGSPFTLALVKHKLEEFDLLDYVKLQAVQPEECLSLGDMIFHFFPVCHSIPQGYALGVETPAGRIIHTGDFKIDANPLSGPGTDVRMFRRFAGKGVRLLMSDSTNVEKDGESLSEREVKASLDKVFQKAEGRIIITLFSSHIQRIQEVFDLAEHYGRTVVISGRSLANNIDMAKSLGLLSVPESFYNAFDGVPEMPDSKIVLIVTGAQGEPMSALSRMTFGTHRQLSIQSGDTVVMSSRVIPGNGRIVSALINEMYRLGAEVLYESVRAIHASGHAKRSELRAILDAVRPEYFVPVHGEYRHLVKHARLAVECGVAEDKALIIEDGHPFTLTWSGITVHDSVPVEYTLVDGKGVGDVGQAVLKERRTLGEEGVVGFSLLLDAATGKIIQGPEIKSLGFVYEQSYNYLFEDAIELILDELESMNIRALDVEDIQEFLRNRLRHFFRKVLDRDPVVIGFVSEI